MTILSIRQLKKDYGKINALRGVSFDVEPGVVFGILGPNGSGKTTLLGLITDILIPTEGSFTLFDQQPSAALRKQLGAFIETPNFYHYLSGQKNLEIVAEIKGHDKSDISRVLDIVNLTDRKDTRFSTYSLGMKQRLAIASCLLGDPDVLILDEPTNGLDPVGIAEIRELIRKLHHEGKTIIMASHLLDEVEKVCTHVAILKKGELVATGSVNEILSHEEMVEVGANNLEALKRAVQQFNGYNSFVFSNNHLQLFFNPGMADLEQLNRFFFDRGVTLNHLQLKKKSLESKFFELTN